MNTMVLLETFIEALKIADKLLKAITDICLCNNFKNICNLETNKLT